MAGLTRFSDDRDTAALLGIASLVASQDEVSDAVALLGQVLCDAVAGRVPLSIDRERLLAAADATTAAIRWLTVNADARMLVEQALATGQTLGAACFESSSANPHEQPHT